MSEQTRPFRGSRDQEEMLALVQADPSACPNVVDLPYRLSSWAFDDPESVGLWHADVGLLAWAVLQTPFWTIDYALRPGADERLHREVLAWADQRARACAGTPRGRPAWFVNIFEGQAQRIRDLEAAGFADQARVEQSPWSKVLLGRELDGELPAPALPAGVVLRPLVGAAEVPAYVALHRAVFGSENMTEAWRLRVLAAPGYDPALDLVAVAPDGHLAGFCVGWLGAMDGISTGQIEPMGVREDWRGRGLGLALLYEALARMQARGARRALVETDNYRDAAGALYERAGFRPTERVLVFRKDF